MLAAPPAAERCGKCHHPLTAEPDRDRLIVCPRCSTRQRVSEHYRAAQPSLPLVEATDGQ